MSLVFITGSCTDEEEVSNDIESLFQTLSSRYDLGISDAAHRGIDEFYFLAPTIVEEPAYYGNFHPNLKPVVEISNDFEFQKIHASFTMDDGSFEKIKVDKDKGQYSVNWDSGESGAKSGGIYRLRVRVGKKVLGSLDVAIVPNKDVKVRKKLIPLVENEVMKVVFRIEDKICPARIEVTPDEATVMIGGTRQFQAIVYNYYDEVLEDQIIQWEIEDTDIASVDENGLVTGLMFGVTNVIAKVGDVKVMVPLFVQEGDDAPRPGRDVVVFNDVNHLDNTGLNDPNNVLLVRNLVNYTTIGDRAEGSKVLFDCGRTSGYAAACSEVGTHSDLHELIISYGFDLEFINSSLDPLTDIPDDVKILFLWLPKVQYTVEEINEMKDFAEEGGRIIFIGEWDGFYTNVGLNVENQFLINMGAFMRNVGNAVNCGYNLLPQESLREHPITRDMTGITIACASVIELGPNDYALFYDLSNTLVLGGVAQIDTNPITELATSRMQYDENARLQLELDPTKTTGY
ncbi:Ig-like domain-containing protein [Echinicola sp. CAU 1574]|uniref:Ig-like domain-containing protein n=1 Tax=Echinicola arenosa TaxID=2774144 RepID=A0ABR9AKH5_9BACT|nr:Ig-like domain-containing protein [Echinicola arenosa]MBD8488852.1 Ig-like domain-containing protein [Echinicola arenosa]